MFHQNQKCLHVISSSFGETSEVLVKSKFYFVIKHKPQNVKSFHIQTVPPHHIKVVPMMYLCFFATF